MLLLGAHLTLAVAASSHVVVLRDVVKANGVGALRVELREGLADSLNAGGSQFTSDAMNEISPVDLGLVPVLLEMREKLLVIGLVQGKLKVA